MGFFPAQYVFYVFLNVREWRKNPKWSFSCCLAVLLPLADLHGDIQGLTGKNVLRQQLQTGKLNVPSIAAILKDSGAIDFTFEANGNDSASHATTKANRRKSVKLKAKDLSDAPYSRDANDSSVSLTLVHRHSDDSFTEV